MNGHALLIGCETDGLTGVGNDLDLIERTLGTRGFAVRRITGPQADRAGILATYRELISTLLPDEPAVVYYSGHGGRVQAPPPEAPVPELAPMDLQFIVPTDFHDSAPGDFRGITSVELSVLLARLCERTANATVILDCCHAARLSRDGALRVKALSQREQYEVLRRHIERLRASGELPAGPLPARGNPDAVRIVACAPEQSAYEYDGAEGRQIGILTESLAIALTEAGTERVTWITLLDRVRRRVLSLCPFQRPEVEGPAQRYVFEAECESDRPRFSVIALGDGRARLSCAALLGVQVGDVFEIELADALISTLRIDRLDSYGAEGPVTLEPGHTTMPPNAKARRTVAAAPTLSVLLPEAADPRAAEVLRVLDAAPDLRPVRPDEPWAAALHIGADGKLALHDRIGPLPGSYATDATGAAAVLRALETLGRALALRALAGGCAWSLGAELVVEWGTVRDGARTPLPAAGSTVHAGDHVYVSVRNDSADPVYLSLIDIGASGQITILTSDDPSGRRLDPGREYVLGHDGLGALPGIALSWPKGLDPAKARPETVLLLVSEAPQDVQPLAGSGVARATPRPDPNSPLNGLLRRLATGRDLRLPEPGSRVLRYDAHTIDFDLDPLPDEGVFLVDERPSQSVLLRTARGAQPHSVAVRLTELLVHRNHAWRDADIRIDTMVATGLRGANAEPAYHARTERFPRIRSGEALPLEDMLLYHGPARDFLDLAIWVSRDTADRPSLGELMAQEAAGLEIQDAIAKLTPGLDALPMVAGAVSAVALSAVLMNVGYKLLRRDCASVIGLYRGSMLAHERFGDGRHPSSGTRRAQDFSLAFTVHDLGALAGAAASAKPFRSVSSRMTAKSAKSAKTPNAASEGNQEMGGKWIRIGGSDWNLRENDVDTVAKVKQALKSGTVARLELLDGASGGTVTVHLNGRTAESVVLDLGLAARPGEISGTDLPARRVRIGGKEWHLPKGDVAETVGRIEQALANGTVEELQLLPSPESERCVTVLLNGRTAQSVAVDLGGGPRPGEISGT